MRHRGLRLSAALSAEHEQLRWPRVECVCGLRRAVVGAEHGVEVAATKAEPTDSSEALAGRRGPWQCASGEEEGAGRAIPHCIRTRERPRWWPHPCPQREGGLNDAGNARRALGVTNLRFDRPNRAISCRCAGGGEMLADRRELSAISDCGSRAVRFDQSDAGRSDSRTLVRALQRQPLPFRSRSGQT